MKLHFFVPNSCLIVPYSHQLITRTRISNSCGTGSREIASSFAPIFCNIPKLPRKMSALDLSLAKKNLQDVIGDDMKM